MTDIGKKIRMDRIMNRDTKRTIIIPMDHGLSIGPVQGLQNMPEIINKVAKGGANAVVLHKGIISTGYRGYGEDVGMIMHLSGSSNLGRYGGNKVEVATVCEAIKMGADAVSVHINIGSDTESEQLRYLGRVAGECAEWGMPLLAMMYPRGKDKDGNKLDPYKAENVAHAARIGAELGADIIKTNYTGDPETFKRVVAGCPVPVITAGGEKTDPPEAFFQSVYESITAGGSGVAAGRNVFQDKDPISIIQVLYGIIHEDMTVEKAMKEYQFNLLRIR